MNVPRGDLILTAKGPCEKAYVVKAKSENPALHDFVILWVDKDTVRT